MAEAGAQLWITQADSDLMAAARLYVAGDHRTYCQAISKFQHGVEKSIKALASAVRDSGIISLKIGYNHEVDALISVLRRLPRLRDNRDIQSHIDRILDSYWTAEIEALSGLAPKKPAPNALHTRNTEYPYEISAGYWTAPASIDAFSVNDVKRFETVSCRIYVQIKEVVSALRHRLK